LLFNKFSGSKKYAFNGYYAYTLFSGSKPEFMLVGIWEREDAKYKPHLMFGLKHDSVNDERLFKEEVLAILAVIKTRRVESVVI
jgi:hypothetical protein